ncbi:uncharacterized protein LOC143034489 [Oratosquilla oratoria]|uniref:uncharacterized protein LOC143034489 n=1 Tax=Oratosquilla oratoria TaxID=337810 RepID=UPI003F7660BD
MLWLRITLLTTSVLLCVCHENKKVDENKVNIDHGSKPKVPAQEEDLVKLKRLQEKFFDLITNTTTANDVRSLEGLVPLLVTDAAGEELWRLLLEGVAIGIDHKDSPKMLLEFWSEAQKRLDPEIVRSIESYVAFGSVLDTKTLPVLLEQFLKKNELLERVQVILGKYGIDTNDVVESVLGKGDLNMKDLITRSMEGVADLTRNAMQTSEKKKSVQVTEERKSTKTTGTSGAPTAKKGNLSLLTPMVARLLKDKTIDLEAEAVIELLEYFTAGSGDLMKYVAPLMALAEGGGSGLSGLAQMAPLLANFMGQGLGTQGKRKTKKEPGTKTKEPDMMGVVGSLLGSLNTGGGIDEKNIASMLNLASTFMGKSKTKKESATKTKEADIMGVVGSLINTINAGGGADRGNSMGSMLNLAAKFMGSSGKKKGDKKGKEASKEGLNLGSLVKAASQIAKMNGLDTGDMMDLASHILKKPLPSQNKNTKKEEQAKTRSSAAAGRDTKSTSTDTSVPHQSNQRKSKNLFDVIGPIVLSMKTGKQCSVMINQALSFGRNLLAKKRESLHDLKEILPGLLDSYMDTKTLKNLSSKLNIPIIIDMISNADWGQFADILQNDVFRQNIIRTITPHVADFIQMMAMDKAQKNIDEIAQNFLASYGFVGVTLDNFPERLGPVIGFLSNGLNLPFKPQDHLTSLRDYAKSTKTWVTTGLKEMSGLQKEELNDRVQRTLEEDIAGGVLSVVGIAKADRTSRLPPTCQQQLLCRTSAKSAQENPDSLRATAVRTASLVFALAPSLDSMESESLYELLKSIYQSDTEDMCMEKYPGNCDAIDGQAVEDVNSEHRSHHISHEDL